MSKTARALEIGQANTAGDWRNLATSASSCFKTKAFMESYLKNVGPKVKTSMDKTIRIATTMKIFCMFSLFLNMIL
jgi:hypothetical protein